MHRPRWLLITDELLGPIGPHAVAVLEQRQYEDVDIGRVPFDALAHLSECLHTSMAVNEEGKHSVAMFLTRQCVETLTLIDLGLQEPAFAAPLLELWRDGRKKAGELRGQLERDIWPKYGPGLWDEPWSEFFANLARAVQPYTHYSPQLRGWQRAVLSYPGGNRFIAATGVAMYDRLKASRITLLHALIIWTLGRLLTANDPGILSPTFSTQIRNLGESIGSSQLLFKKSAWEWQLLPDMLFKPGHDWMDP